MDLILNKKHLTKEGLDKILSIKAYMNLGCSPPLRGDGLSDELKSNFPYIIPIKRPLVLNQKIKDPSWLAGFTSGEGSFFVGIIKSSTHRQGFQVKLAFELAQHSRDKELLESLINFFGCGKIYKKNKELFNYRVVNISDLEYKIIPFFFF